ncbi:hypothetical protein [Gordonia amicalis]|uniref:Uncharacterized protein n=1 Tax=Gordonia amicalis TaxID=89053 RepID=A0ABU4DKV9_9ACTN|nr:hypothetical protein [Gordonia amicalis]MDV6309919.1 hypothetical protein [Gordonia amicalis]
MKDHEINRRLEALGRRIDKTNDCILAVVNTVGRENAESLRLSCYELATKTFFSDLSPEAVLEEAKRLHDWVTGRDEPVGAANDGSEDLGGRRYGSLRPPAEYPEFG